MKRTFVKAALCAVALSVVASGCGLLGGSKDPGEEAKEISTKPAQDVAPPEQVDPRASAQPGLVLSTNSRSWNGLVDSAEGPGAVVIFVQPGGPSDGKGIARGDVITEIDGEKMINHELAIARLRSRPGQKRELKFVKRDGSERTVSIDAKNPAGATLRQFLNPMLDANKNDAVLLFLRAQTAGTYDANLADVNKALELEPKFVEALTLKSSILWDHRLVDRENATKLANEALAGWKSALDLDPDNVTALSVRSTALTALGNGAGGREDADKTIELDSSYPRAYFAKALAFTRLNEAADALAPASVAVQLNPYNLQYFRLLAGAFVRLERKADCVKTADAMRPFLEAQQPSLKQDADALRRICQ